MPFQLKTIIILCLVQTGILLILLGKIVFFEEESTDLGDASQNISVNNPFDERPTDSHAATTYYPDENRLRKIVREELAAQLGALSEVSTQEDSATVLEPEDEVKYQYQRELVAQQLNYHTSVGRISDMDMQMLQMEIAKLDEAGRREMLGRLTRAMNSGELDGRL